jgi:L-fuconolactonase
MRRRDMLRLAVSAGVACVASPIAYAVSSIPIIDSHVHLFDPRRPGGVPWPEKSDTAIYKTALPARYAKIAGPLGVIGAIAVEASPLVRDNDWVLRVAASNPIVVGMVGNLVPGSTDYLRELERLQRSFYWICGPNFKISLLFFPVSREFGPREEFAEDSIHRREVDIFHSLR